MILRLKVLLWVFLGLVIAGSLPAQTLRNLSRNQEAVIVAGGELTQFLGADIDGENNEIFVFAYRDASKAWEQIPFQIDERDANNDYFGSDDAGLDSNDELVFMAKDAGDEASMSWIPDAGSTAFVRYALRVFNPIAPAEQAWVYVYRSTTLSLDESLNDYVSYHPSTTGEVAEDTIRTNVFEVAHERNGFPKDLMIHPAAGGNDEDLLDRLKFRSKASISFLSFDIDENDIVFNDDDDVAAIDGLIRVIRRLDATLSVSVVNANFVSPPFFYYPHQMILDIRVPSISGPSISFGRMSFDLSRLGSGMKFVSRKNPEPGFLVDGVSDDPDRIVDDILPDDNWVYIGNQLNTIVHLFPLATNVGGQRRLYYKDDNSTDDNDLGDRFSFGDTGINITDGLSTPFTLSYRGFYTGGGESSDLGAQVAAWARMPLQVDATEEDAGSVPVELAAFTADVQGNDVTLRWVTATETNNFGFEVERRKEGSDAWQKLDFIPGNGTTVIPQRYEYLDTGLAAGSYVYRLKQIDFDGAFEYSPEIAVTTGVPQTFALHQNYPNPFNPATTIRFEIPVLEASDFVELTIFDVRGRRVTTLVSGLGEPGFHTVTWDGTDASGAAVASGVFFFRLTGPGFAQTRKMLLVR